MSLKSLPVHIKEEVLLNLPYESVSFISTGSFWKKKAMRDFGVNLSLDTAKEEYEDIDYANKLLQNLDLDSTTRLLEIIQKYPEWQNSQKLFRRISNGIIGELFHLYSEDDEEYQDEIVEKEDKLEELCKVALRFELDGNQNYTNWLLYELFDTGILIDTTPHSPIYEVFYTLFRGKKQIKVSRLFEVLMRLFNSEDEAEIVWENEGDGNDKFLAFQNLIEWLEHEELDLVKDVAPSSLASKILASKDEGYE
jgi:hypothetical protein